MTKSSLTMINLILVAQILSIPNLASSETDTFIKDDRKNAEIYLSQGYAYFLSGNYQQAIADLTIVIEARPSDEKIMSSAYAIRGDAYFKMTDAGRALADWKHAARLGNKGAQDLLREKKIQW